MIKLVLLVLIIVSCSSLNDYHNSDKYKIKQRQEESYKMFKETHRVREKCSTKRQRFSPRRKKRYYS